MALHVERSAGGCSESCATCAWRGNKTMRLYFLFCFLEFRWLSPDQPITGNSLLKRLLRVPKWLWMRWVQVWCFLISEFWSSKSFWIGLFPQLNSKYKCSPLFLCIWRTLFLRGIVPVLGKWIWQILRHPVRGDSTVSLMFNFFHSEDFISVIQVEFLWSNFCLLALVFSCVLIRTLPPRSVLLPFKFWEPVMRFPQAFSYWSWANPVSSYVRFPTS